MNLHSVAQGIISPVNPWINVTVQTNTGYSTADDGTRTPTYTYKQKVPAQIQPLTFDEIRYLDGLNIQGIKRAIYIKGQLHGVDRSRNIGGDLITFPQGWKWPYGTIWLAVLVVEQWPDWSKVVCTQQLSNDSPNP